MRGNEGMRLSVDFDTTRGRRMKYVVLSEKKKRLSQNLFF